MTFVLGQVLRVSDFAAACFSGSLTAALDACSAAGGGATRCWAATAGGSALGLASLNDFELGIVETGKGGAGLGHLHQ